VIVPVFLSIKNLRVHENFKKNLEKKIKASQVVFLVGQRNKNLFFEE
jgi:hypothetical protein